MSPVHQNQHGYSVVQTSGQPRAQQQMRQDKQHAALTPAAGTCMHACMLSRSPAAQPVAQRFRQGQKDRHVQLADQGQRVGVIQQAWAAHSTSGRTMTPAGQRSSREGLSTSVLSTSATAGHGITALYMWPSKEPHAVSSIASPSARGSTGSGGAAAATIRVSEAEGPAEGPGQGKASMQQKNLCPGWLTRSRTIEYSKFLQGSSASSPA